MCHFPFVLFVALSVVGASVASLHHRQCSRDGTLSNADVIINELQSKFWNSFSGSYTSGELWTDANALEDIHDYMLLSDGDAYGYMANVSKIGQAASNPLTDWTEFFGGSYDDAQWVILAIWKMSDWKTAHGQDDRAFMANSLAIYDVVAAQWDDTCGGGVWWSSDHTYKNAITNELFLLTSAEAYLRTKNETYLRNAKKEYTWLMNSGMQGPDGLFNDGLDLATCKNNHQTTWTYNQAVIASGLGALYVADGASNKTYLDRAQTSLDATIRLVTENDILKESCDDAYAGGTVVCDNDQKLFKGLWTKHVAYFVESAGEASLAAKYGPFLLSQRAAVFDNAMNATHDVGSVWYAKDRGGSLWGPQSSTSGLEATIAAAKLCASAF